MKNRASVTSRYRLNLEIPEDFAMKDFALPATVLNAQVAMTDGGATSTVSSEPATQQDTAASKDPEDTITVLPRDEEPQAQYHFGITGSYRVNVFPRKPFPPRRLAYTQAQWDAECEKWVRKGIHELRKRRAYRKRAHLEYYWEFTKERGQGWHPVFVRDELI